MSDRKVQVTVTPDGKVIIDSHSFKGECTAVMDTIRKAFSPTMNMGAVTDTNDAFIKDAKVVANANQG